MNKTKRNRFTFVREKPEQDILKQDTEGRIKSIELEKRRFLPVIIASSAAVLVVIAVIIITQYYYKKPQIFTPEKQTVLHESETKEIPQTKTENIHLRKGKDSY